MVCVMFSAETHFLSLSVPPQEETGSAVLDSAALPLLGATGGRVGCGGVGILGGAV